MVREATYSDRRRRDVTRIKALGRFGELTAIEMLRNYRQDGNVVFTNVIDLNYPKENYKYADVLADITLRGQTNRVLISVKTRNKFERKYDPEVGKYVPKKRGGKPSINIRYNILDDAQNLARELEVLHAARAAWVSVEVDAAASLYSCYFGYLSECEKKGIIMEPKYIADSVSSGKYLCLAQNQNAAFDISHLHNDM